MGDPHVQLEKLRKSIAALEAQRPILGDEALEPALAALRQQIASLEAEAVAPAPAQPTTPSEDRRVVTILFSDIVGSTALAEKLDPEEWTEIIKPAFDSLIPPVYDHGGTVARLMGDAILAFFGAPEAHEDDAERAILAGLAIVERVRQYSEKLKAERNIELKVRVGINTGLVVVGNIGNDLKSEYTAMGDAINLASRLQSAAPPGSILISHDTLRYVRGVFDVTPQPPLTVKGKSAPVKTYLVKRARAHPFRVAVRGVAGIQTRTIGRDQELKSLQSAYKDACDNGGVVWAQLVGEPGVGKSRVMSDFTEWLDLQPEGFTLLRARAFLGDTANAFALIRRMWFDRFQIAEDAPRAAAEATWVRAFRNLSGSADEEPAHALGLLAGLPFEKSPYLGMLRDDPVQVRGRAFVVSRDLVRKLRAKAPLVLLLEDLHWADVSSLEYLMEVFVAGEAGGHGLFILSTARPEWTPPQLPNKELARDLLIKVAPLDSTSSKELTLELLRRVEGVPEHLIQSIVERSEGVPYFAEELVNLFIDRGLIDQSSEPWHFVAERLDSLPLPATLQHLLHTRLLALPEDERVCLQRGAVFGRHFW
ncbi:MAG: adenylate/guanylate cyclase domain-containing protein, partial [Rudaea sp.]